MMTENNISYPDGLITTVIRDGGDYPQEVWPQRLIREWRLIYMTPEHALRLRPGDQIQIDRCHATVKRVGRQKVVTDGATMREVAACPVYLMDNVRYV